MKYLIAILIVVLLLIQIAKAQTWMQQTSGTSTKLEEIFFTDENTGWVIGFSISNFNVILKTTNGGINWSSQTAPGGSLFTSDIYMVNSSTGFICTRTGQVLKTTDGGNLWSISLALADYDFISITFADANTGYTVGGSGVIYKTTNAGTSWTPQVSGQSDFLYEVVFTAPDTGYVTANIGKVLRTFDGGSTWISQTVDAFDQVTALYFADDNTGYTAGTSQLKMYKTTNKGLNWSPISILITGNKTDIEFTNASTGYVTTSTSQLFKTTNGGTNWTLQLNSASGLFGMHFVNQTTGYVTGNSGLIYYTNNQPLPVELGYFYESVSGNNVTLKWGTVWELNNSRFEIERMENSNPVWQKTGEIAGNGTVNNQIDYSFTDINLKSGEYFYRLKQIDYNGNYEYYNLSGSVMINKPNNFEVMQNYPNPSNPKSKIDFNIPTKGFLSVKVYDLTGREVMTLMQGYKAADFYSVEFDGSGLSSGVYFYRVEVAGDKGNFSQIKKLVLVK